MTLVGIKGVTIGMQGHGYTKGFIKGFVGLEQPGKGVMLTIGILSEMFAAGLLLINAVNRSVL